MKKSNYLTKTKNGGCFFDFSKCINKEKLKNMTPEEAKKVAEILAKVK